MADLGRQLQEYLAQSKAAAASSSAAPAPPPAGCSQEEAGSGGGLGAWLGPLNPFPPGRGGRTGRRPAGLGQRDGETGAGAGPGAGHGDADEDGAVVHRFHCTALAFRLGFPHQVLSKKSSGWHPGTAAVTLGTRFAVFRGSGAGAGLPSRPPARDFAVRQSELDSRGLESLRLRVGAGSTPLPYLQYRTMWLLQPASKRW